MAAQIDFRSQRFQLVILLVLISLTGGLLWFNLKLSSPPGLKEEPIYFQTSGNFQIKCPFKQRSDCLGIKIRETADNEDELVHLAREGTEFVSCLEGEATYAMAGFRKGPESITFYPSLVIENQNRRVRYIFSGEALPNLRWVKEGETLGNLGPPIKEEEERYNLIIWAEQDNQRLKIFK
ncbi:MAG: hypothetical protein H5T64_12625 [Chloroflexi bacterium]|nr:hypothetical protein [Chloroflexota bacterium]